jgi:hypothetical protein
MVLCKLCTAETGVRVEGVCFEDDRLHRCLAMVRAFACVPDQIIPDLYPHSPRLPRT